MKITLIMLVAIAAVAIGASVAKRDTWESGMDIEGAGAGAESTGYDAAAESALEQTKDKTVAGGRASTAYGRARTSAVSVSGKIRESGNEENGEQRSA